MTQTAEGPEGRAAAGTRAAVFAIAAAVIVAAAVLGVLAYRRVAGQAQARADVTEAARLLERVDATVRRVDEVVRRAVEPEIADEAAEAAEKVPAAKREAAEAARLFDGAVPGLPSSERARAREAADAARLRERLLDAAGPLLEATAKAAEAIGPAEEGWALLLDVEERSDEAVSLYNTHERDDVEESLELTERAQEDAARALTLFEKASSALPEADLGRYAEYAEDRLEALRLAERADRAFLGGDVGEANSLSEQVNEREAELTAAARKLPRTPAEAVDEGYDEVAGDAQQRYYRLRDRLVERP